MFALRPQKWSGMFDFKISTVFPETGFSFNLGNAVATLPMPRYTLLRKALGTNGVVPKGVKGPFALSSPRSGHIEGSVATQLRSLGLKPMQDTKFICKQANRNFCCATAVMRRNCYIEPNSNLVPMI
jgi:hypothetical protein